MDMISFNLGMIVVYYYINYIIIGQCFYRVVWEWRVLFIELNIVFRVVCVYYGFNIIFVRQFLWIMWSYQF